MIKQCSYAAFLLSIFFLLGCTTEEVSPSQIEVNYTDPAVICEEIESYGYREKCYWKKAVFNEDLSICNKLEDPLRYASCHGQLAIINKDVSLCIFSDERRNESCIHDVRKEKSNMGNCEDFQFEFTKDNCYMNKGIIERNLTHCKSVDYHGKVKECIAGIAMAEKDETICDEYYIQFGGFKNVFVPGCHKLVALEKNDISFCEQIQPTSKRSTDRDLCYSDFGKLNLDMDICRKITYTEGYRVGCMKEIAVANRNISLCEELKANYGDSDKIGTLHSIKMCFKLLEPY